MAQQLLSRIQAVSFASWQVGTSDGRIKIVGRPGVERLMLGNDASGTRALSFLSGKGALVRVTQVG